MRLLNYFIFTFLFFTSLDTFAETVTGCRIGSDNFLYTGYQGVQPYPVSQWYIPTFPTYTNPKKDFLQAWYNSYSSCPFFVGNPSYGAQCAVQGITYVDGNKIKNLGNTITYTISYECPIDNEVIVLLFSIGALSVYYLRRKFVGIDLLHH